MQLNIKGIPVQVADDQVARIVQQHFMGDGIYSISIMPQAALHNINVPPIGSVWPGQGGIFTGLARGRDGQPDYLLITGPEIDELPWQQAMDAAAQIEVDGHKDFTLPYRAEQALQYANIPEAFKQEWYWSREQRAALAAWAWVQYVSGGNQDGDPKGGHSRARAVRRLIIR